MIIEAFTTDKTKLFTHKEQNKEKAVKYINNHGVLPHISYVTLNGKRYSIGKVISCKV